MGQTFGISRIPKKSQIHSISAHEFFNLQNDGWAFVLVLDFRCAANYKRSHIDTSVHVVSLLSAEELVQKHSYSHIVLVNHDEDSMQWGLVSAAISKGLANIGRRLAIDVAPLQSRAPGPVKLLVLGGGFPVFKKMYPYLCSDHVYFVEGRLFPSVIEYSGSAAVPPSTKSVVADGRHFGLARMCIGDDLTRPLASKGGTAIFLSNFGVAKSPGVLRLLGITHIVNCTCDCPFPSESSCDVTEAAAVLAAAQADDDVYRVACAKADLSLARMQCAAGPAAAFATLRVPVIDSADTNISIYFARAIAFMDVAMRGEGRILFHCKHGQSRSATVLAAWLIQRRNHSTGSALQLLKTCRPRVSPNRGFREQLQRFEKGIQAKNSAQAASPSLHRDTSTLLAASKSTEHFMKDVFTLASPSPLSCSDPTA